MKGLTLGLAHELGLMAALTLSILIVLLGGEMPPWLWLSALAPALSMGLSRRGRSVPAVAGTVLAFGAIATGVITLVRGGLDAAVFAGGATVLGLTVARLLTRKTLAHDQQALLLSLVLVFAGSVLNVGISYFVVFVAYAIAAVWALSTRQLLAGAEENGASAQQARQRSDVITPLFFAATAGVSIVVLLAAVLIFVSFPRIGFGELGFLGRRGSQLPGEVGYGSSPRGLSTSTSVVARVSGVSEADFDEGLYLRGITYDTLSFDAFAQSAPDAVRAVAVDSRANVPSIATGDARDVRYEVMQFPVGGQLLFTLGFTRSSIPLGGGNANPNRVMGILGRDRHDELRTAQPLASPFRFEVHGGVAAPGAIGVPRARAPQLDDDERARYLQLPAADASVEALLTTMLGAAAAGDDVARAAAIRTYLLRTFRYSLEDQVVGLDAPLKRFLLEARAGHCELFAGSYALLLRMTGIPARVVGGYQGGALADDATIVFQQRHAHAWVEWWKDGHGWIVDDATPQATASRERLGGFNAFVESVRRLWDDQVLDYSLQDQTSAMRGISRALRGKHLGTIFRIGVVVVLVVGVVVVVVRRLRRRGRVDDVGDRLGVEIVATIERLADIDVAAADTIAEAVARRPEPALHDALRHYERHRYGNERLEAAVVDDVVARLRALRRPKDAANKTR